MKIEDSRGRQIEEVTVRLTEQEVTELLVSTSAIDDGTTDHALMRDETGATLALYVDDQAAPLLERATDWWVGPIVLALIILLVIGAFTVARSIVDAFF